MAKISEILDIEKDRNEQDKWNIIHLFKEGGFYRAYNWSAWLIVTFSYNDEVRKETKDRKPLAVSRKKLKNSDDDFVFVGFPLKSLDKFIPGNIGFNPITDTQIDVTINLSYDDDTTYEILQEEYETWKDGIKISEDKSKHEKTISENVTIAPRSISSVMAQVLSYPLESKTPIENMEFISLLKSQLASLF